MAELTEAERKWIALAKRLARKCPPTLGLFIMDTDVEVVVLNEHGGSSHEVNGRDNHVCTVDTLSGIRGSSGQPDWIDFDDLERPWVQDGGPRA